jgi:hypothetical protein
LFDFVAIRAHHCLATSTHSLSQSAPVSQSPSQLYWTATRTAANPPHAARSARPSLETRQRCLSAPSSSQPAETKTQ